ncbi:hypothetical protein NOMA109596_06605 [Nocardioides marinus]|uniref:SurA N-terminal domain-containing protein n=1 Tax=Nocardioides marinus TaxID=374514 RepID=A0A7Y9YFE4_9ACTN|nr:hypothetical protein [Nocardioides marinus]NYI11235.1 hypothetical protein [Nocardioides marinus]
MRLSRPLVGLATVAVLATGALSGCGVADAGVRPGAAAVVEGEEISLGEVDDATTATCEVLQGSADLLAGGFTGAELRGIVVQQLVVTEVAEAIAADNDLPADEVRREAEKQARISFGLAGDDQNAAVTVFAASSFLTSVVSEIVDPTLSEDELVQPGPAYQAYLEQWQAEHDVEVNPRFDQVDFATSASDSTTSDLSVAVSQAASLRAEIDELRARAQQGDVGAQAEITALVSGLPDSQGCAPEVAETEPEPTMPIPLENPGNPNQG